MKSIFGKTLAVGAVGVLAALSLSHSHAQTPAPAPAAAAAPGGAAPAAGGRGGRGAAGPAETWYVNKKNAVVYVPPNKPLWKLSDLLQMHSGQNNWTQEVLRDELQDVTYNSAAPGTKFIPRIHQQTATVYVIMKGEVHFVVEGQDPVTATRGGIVNIMDNTIYSYDVTGTENALWININPLGYRSEYPTTEAPPPPEAGTTLTKVAFAHRPGAYTGNNKLYFNLFDAIAKCQPVNGVVNDDHLRVGPLLGWVNPADNKCPPGGTGNIGSGPPKPGDPPFDTNGTFGHLHEGVREWWIVQSGSITGNFEKTGIFHAVEGDILNAEQDMWHQMAATAPSGPSVRTAVGAYGITNMNNTAATAAGGQ